MQIILISLLEMLLKILMVMGKSFTHYSITVSGDEIVFKNLNRRCSVILGFEVANSVLAHLSGTITPESMQSENSNFTEQERNIIKYISG